MPAFESLYTSFIEGDIVKFKVAISKFKSVDATEEDEPLVVYLTRILGEDQSVGKEEIINFLATAGVNFNVHDSSDRTPLCNLAFNNNLHYFKLLIGLGANINYASNANVTPIEWAIRSNYSLDVARFIFSNDMYVPPKLGVLANVAKRSGAKNSVALLKELKIK